MLSQKRLKELTQVIRGKLKKSFSLLINNHINKDEMINISQCMNKEPFKMKYDLSRKLSNYEPAILRVLANFD